MKTLAGYTILYDAECPMCNLYSQAFVATGMLDKTGRASYQQMPEAACPLVDRQRAINEIALVNTQTGEVNYGIRSLLKVIGHAFPVFGPLFNFSPFAGLMSKVYAFISYNRKVIIPAKADENGLQPTFNLFYRLLYLLFTSLSVGFILTHYAGHLTAFVPIGSPYREYMICSGQVLFQGIIVALYRPAKKWDYLGNMMTISFAGALLLLPMLIIAKFAAIPAIIFILYFLAVAGLMFLEHIRRTKILDLGWLLTITWAAYRLGILLLIFYFN
jgi:predicted DCC family thiol-disulfide oxidoreductase YuxK